MSPRAVCVVLAAALAALAPGAGALAQSAPTPGDAAEARRALAEAQGAGQVARVRAERLESDAARTGEAAARTAQETAAVAARIQQAEAEAAADEARISLIEQQRAGLRADLAARQRPLMQLTAALQRLARRPLVLALLRPGSVRDAVHMRALIETMIPEVQRRTAGLRAAIARGQALQQQARAAQAALRREQQALGQRRQALAGLETRQRLAARAVSGDADRESERALAFAEQARDLGGLVTIMDKAGALGDALAALPGPILRPTRPDTAAVVAVETTVARPANAGPSPYLLPVTGRLVAGFGAAGASAPTHGIALAPRAGAIAIAPAAGRVAFAGPYRGYGQIVIITHAGGWTSLVTGLARLDVAVSDNLVVGAPLGVVGPGQPVLNLELRQGGTPVNPLDLIGRK